MSENRPPTVIPVAPPVRRGPPVRLVRAALVVVGLLLAGVFAVACYINPYGADGTPRTMSTHTQLGLEPCNFVVLTGKPCPTCGMTTSFALLVRGDVRASLEANWVGTTLAVFWAGLMIWALASGFAGRPLFVPRGKGELLVTIAVGFFLMLMLARWAGIML